MRHVNLGIKSVPRSVFQTRVFIRTTQQIHHSGLHGPTLKISAIKRTALCFHHTQDIIPLPV